MTIKKLLKSFRDALRGIVFCIYNERNMRIHTVAVVYVLFLSLFFDLSRGEYAALLLVMAVVVAAEMINTSIEVLTDIGAPQYNSASRIAKDVAAGGVLVAALFAVGVGLCLFTKAEGYVRLYDYLTGAFYRIPLLLLSGAVSLVFVFAGPQKMKAVARRLSKKKRSK